MTRPGAPPGQARQLDRDGAALVGSANKSLWQWSAQPGTPSPRDTDDAPANPSTGINGVLLDSVNAGVAGVGQSFSNGPAVVGRHADDDGLAPGPGGRFDEVADFLQFSATRHVGGATLV